jgi:2'-5' RNA ligase
MHAMLKRQPPPPPAELQVRYCSLMESTLKPGGAVYAQLATFPLEGR